MSVEEISVGSVRQPMSGQRILVTGGTSSIGSAIVTLLAGNGARVIFTGRDIERGNGLAGRTGSSFLFVDARDASQVRENSAAAIESLGGLDGLVLAAGVLHEGPLLSTPDEAWDELLATNLKAAFACATACLPALREGEEGSIVAIASAAALWPDTAAGAYAVSKRAVLALTEMLAAEAAPHVRVNAICPGDTELGMHSMVSGGTRAIDDTPLPLPPLGRHAQSLDIAEAVAFFLSERASFCTAGALRVDGGLRGAHRS